MSQASIAEAKNQLTRLIHRAEQGQPVHITRRGKPVAVLVSEQEYARLHKASERRSFWELVEEMRADPGFTAIDLTPEEVDSWRDRRPGPEFEWPE